MIPGTLPTGTRRRVPKVSQNRKVPLWTVEPEGQLFTGVIRVPVGLCHTEEHTNARLRFNALITTNLERWAKWREARGWFLTEKPRVAGPFDPPESDRERAKQYHERVSARIGESPGVGVITDFDYGQEFKWYTCEARFRREEPVFIRLSDMLEMRHRALQYGIDPDRDPLPYTELPESKDHLTFEGGLDPMVVAEERRKLLGLKRSDFLMGKLSDPL